jgi:hypothetical protein
MSFLPQKKILIFQVSPPHTASTVLVNALYGIIEDLRDQPVFFYDYSIEPYIILDNRLEKEFAEKNIVIVKTHNTNIDSLINLCKDTYELFFICSQRVKENLCIDQKYMKYKNVHVFNFVELNETSENTLLNIIDNIYDRLYRFLSEYECIKLNKENGIKRVCDMNKIYDEIRKKPFTYVNTFYHIHGSHRNRKI